MRWLSFPALKSSSRIRAVAAKEQQGKKTIMAHADLPRVLTQPCVGMQVKHVRGAYRVRVTCASGHLLTCESGKFASTHMGDRGIAMRLPASGEVERLAGVRSFAHFCH